MILSLSLQRVSVPCVHSESPQFARPAAACSGIFGPMSLRLRAGALLYDWPRFELAMRGIGPYARLAHPWVAIRNRNERLTLDGRGARCEWEFTSDLHIARVFPSAGARLMACALRDFPIRLTNESPPATEQPEVSFIIGHRGLDRAPHLAATLQSIAAQRGASIECIVVEQAETVETRSTLPAWVRYLHAPPRERGAEYSRAQAFNAGAAAARGRLLVLHDNDMLCPVSYAAEVVNGAARGADFIDLKRFLFYFDEAASRAVFAEETLPRTRPVVVQNAQGGSVAASRQAFYAIGGFDDAFVGWGGEDNEFRERADTAGRLDAFGYLPFVHLWHAPQPGKLAGRDAPAVRRYHEIASEPPAERIRRLRAARGGER